MRWRRWMVGGLILGLTLVMWWAVLGGATPATGETLTIAVPDEPPGLDPTTSPAAAIARIVYNNLLEGLGEGQHAGGGRARLGGTLLGID